MDAKLQEVMLDITAKLVDSSKLQEGLFKMQIDLINSIKPISEHIKESYACTSLVNNPKASTPEKMSNKALSLKEQPSRGKLDKKAEKISPFEGFNQ